MTKSDHYITEVHLPTDTLGACRNVKNCGNGSYPPYKVTLGDGWCMSCYDKKIAGGKPHLKSKAQGRRGPITAFP